MLVVFSPHVAVAQYESLLPTAAPTVSRHEGVVSCLPGFRDVGVERRNGLSYRIAHLADGIGSAFFVYAAQIGTCRVRWKERLAEPVEAADFDAAAPNGFVVVTSVTLAVTRTFTTVYDASSGAEILHREIAAIAYYGKHLFGISGDAAAFAVDPPTGAVLVCNLRFHEYCGSLELKPVPSEFAGAANMNFSIVSGKFLDETAPTRPPSVEGCYALEDLARDRVREVSLSHCR